MIKGILKSSIYHLQCSGCRTEQFIIEWSLEDSSKEDVDAFRCVKCGEINLLISGEIFGLIHDRKPEEDDLNIVNGIITPSLLELFEIKNGN